MKYNRKNRNLIYIRAKNWCRKNDPKYFYSLSRDGQRELIHMIARAEVLDRYLNGTLTSIIKKVEKIAA